MVNGFPASPAFPMAVTGRQKLKWYFAFIQPINESANPVQTIANRNEFASLMLSLMTFGAGFLMRPLGAIVLGAYMDHRGRRDGLLLTLGLMAIGTASIACTPSYASIGLIASPADFHVSVQSGDQACRPTTCAPES